MEITVSRFPTAELEMVGRAIGDAAIVQAVGRARAVNRNVEAPKPDDFCHFLLTSNFALQPLVPQGKARSASLENIAWIPGGGKTPAAPAADSSTPTSQQ